MALIVLNDAHFDYGREKILRGASVALQPQVKCALVGANGAGKTTLLSALAGELDLPAGVRQARGGTQIRFLRQETELDPAGDGTRPLIEVVGGNAFARERALEAELAELSRLIERSAGAEQAALVQRQGRLQVEFERLDGYTLQSRLETALRGVGLAPETWPRPTARLSGGERRRAALASVLLSNADLLLLDEPTNHLDLESCEWLEGYLGQCPGAALIVSHDRQFLDRVTTRTLHLERGRLVSYSGNYSFFDEQSRLRFDQDLAAFERQQARIRQTEEYIRRNLEGQKTRQAQSRRKQLAKEEVLERPTTEPGLYRFRLRPLRQSGGTVFQAEGLAKGFGPRTLLAGLDLHVSRGERIGIVGPNGCGKSTLLKLLAGREFPDAGRVVPGHNVDVGYYDQELSTVSDHNTVIGEMASVDPTATLGELRGFLAAFGFGEDLFDRQVGRLSGGERGRLALLRLIQEGHNTLLLDEPTNHLDIRSRESLEAALAEFAGTLVVISHDRRFLDKVVQRLIVFPGAGQAAEREAGRLRLFAGSYAEYVRRRAEEPVAATAAAAGPRPAAGGPPPVERPGVLSKNEQERRRRWIAEVEAEILELEAAKEAAMAEMARPDLDNAARISLAERFARIDHDLAERMVRWEQWHLEIEEGT